MYRVLIDVCIKNSNLNIRREYGFFFKKNQILGVSYLCSSTQAPNQNAEKEKKEKKEASSARSARVCKYTSVQARKNPTRNHCLETLVVIQVIGAETSWPRRLAGRESHGIDPTCPGLIRIVSHQCRHQSGFLVRNSIFCVGSRCGGWHH